MDSHFAPSARRFTDIFLDTKFWKNSCYYHVQKFTHLFYTAFQLHLFSNVIARVTSLIQLPAVEGEERGAKFAGVFDYFDIIFVSSLYELEKLLTSKLCTRPGDTAEKVKQIYRYINYLWNSVSSTIFTSVYYSTNLFHYAVVLFLPLLSSISGVWFIKLIDENFDNVVCKYCIVLYRGRLEGRPELPELRHDHQFSHSFSLSLSLSRYT